MAGVFLFIVFFIGAFLGGVSPWITFVSVLVFVAVFFSDFIGAFRVAEGAFFVDTSFVGTSGTFSFTDFVAIHFFVWSFF